MIKSTQNNDPKFLPKNSLITILRYDLKFSKKIWGKSETFFEKFEFFLMKIVDQMVNCCIFSGENWDFFFWRKILKIINEKYENYWWKISDILTKFWSIQKFCKKGWPWKVLKNMIKSFEIRLKLKFLMNIFKINMKISQIYILENVSQNFDEKIVKF